MKVVIETWGEKEHWLKFVPENKLEERALWSIYLRSYEKDGGRVCDAEQAVAFQLEHHFGDKKIPFEDKTKIQELLEEARKLGLEEIKKLKK